MSYPKVSLLISTYNSPDYLKLTLKSVLYQNRLPDEILIADDGSGESTKEVVESFNRVSPVPVKHIWQPDNGFRLSAIRNKAIMAADGDYIIQIDGDIIMHPYFIADHTKYAKEGCYIGASRVFITPFFSKILLTERNFDYHEIRQHCNRKFKSLRLPFLTPLFYRSNSSNFIAIHGCNMAYWRDDAISINGYNEDIHGWGCEDCEFAVRLSKFGLKKRWIKFSAIAFHIHHNQTSRNRLKYNDEIMTAALKSNLFYTPNGIKK